VWWFVFRVQGMFLFYLLQFITIIIYDAIYIYTYGERVVGYLREWYVSLIQEVERCRIMVETEVAKAEVKMQIENAALRKEIKIE
jgi:hypothetical protein